MDKRKNKYIPKIYKITNKVTNKSYIGKSVNVFSRWGTHITNAKKYKNRNHKLYSAINNSQINNWSFEILEIIDVPFNIIDKIQIDKFALTRELYWICYYDSIKNGYNRNITFKKK